MKSDKHSDNLFRSYSTITLSLMLSLNKYLCMGEGRHNFLLAFLSKETLNT